MTKLFGPLLYEQNILDAQGQYVEPLVPLADILYLPDTLGERFFEALSPDFAIEHLPQFGHVSSLPKSFKELKGKDDSVKFFPQGFILQQKEAIFAVQLLARADWNSDGDEEYLVLVRLQKKEDLEKAEKKEQEKQNKAAFSLHSDYYLVLESLEEPLFHAQVVGLYSYADKKAQAFGLKEKEAEASFETRHIEVEAGMRPVVLPPAKEPVSDNEGAQENSLSE